MNKGHFTVLGRATPVGFGFILALTGLSFSMASRGDSMPDIHSPLIWLPLIAWCAMSVRSLTCGAFVLPGGRVRCRRLFSTVEVTVEEVANCEVSDDVSPFGYIHGPTPAYGARLRLKDGRGLQITAIFGRRQRVERICRKLLQEIRLSRS